MENLKTPALVRIAQTGGNIVMSIRDRQIGEFIRILKAGAECNATLTLLDASELSTPHLVRIAQAGVGRVTFR